MSGICLNYFGSFLVQEPAGNKGVIRCWLPEIQGKTVNFKCPKSYIYIYSCYENE
jgi:hypothetical protein